MRFEFVELRGFFEKKRTSGALFTPAFSIASCNSRVCVKAFAFSVSLNLFTITTVL